MLQLLEEAGTSDSGSQDPPKVSKPKTHEEKFTYSTKDAILYALGVGVSVKDDMSHMKFLYEGHKNFSVLPTFAVIPAQVWIRSIS